MEMAHWVHEYTRERRRFERLTSELEDLVRKLVHNAGVRATIQARTKDIGSFAAKISRPDKNYEDPLSDVTDLSGVRVIVDTLADVERVAAIIRAEFEVDEKRSINKADQLDPDRFGYLSQHFIVRPSPARAKLSEWSGFGGLYAEIQVRTALQHAWSIVQHPLDYKSATDVPRPLRRRLYRLSALFELADSELDSLMKDASTLRQQYAATVRSGAGDLELNLDSLRAFVEQSEEVESWAAFVRTIPNTVVEGPNYQDRDVLMPHMCGITSIGDYERLLRQSRGWGNEFLREALLTIRGGEGRALSITRNGIPMYLLIGNYPDVLAERVLMTRFGFGNPEPTLALARRMNPRIASGS